MFLSALGLLAGGDLPSGKYSIGGADSRVPNTLGPSLGASHHGPFEVDQSISRIDTYFGNNADFNLERFNNIRKIADSHGGQFGMETWAEERAETYQLSRETNPEFDAGPKHLAVTLAERVFIFRALPNGTFLGLADEQNVLPFYLNETFPDDWFRRSTSYNLENVGTDIVALYAMGPTEIGKNQGFSEYRLLSIVQHVLMTTDNFVPATGVDFGTLDSDAATCFLLTSLLDLAPGSFSSAIVDNFDIVKGFMQGAIAPLFAGRGCTINYTKPGGTVGQTTPGSSTSSNYLVNGVYQ